MQICVHAAFRSTNLTIAPPLFGLFSPGIWWIGFRMNLSGLDVQILQVYS